MSDQKCSTTNKRQKISNIGFLSLLSVHAADVVCFVAGSACSKLSSHWD